MSIDTSRKSRKSIKRSQSSSNQQKGCDGSNKLNFSDFLFQKQELIRNHQIQIKQNCKKVVQWSWEMLGTIFLMVETFNGMKDKIQFSLKKVEQKTNDQQCKDLQNAKYILVLDLDETLIHSSEKRTSPDDHEVIVFDDLIIQKKVQVANEVEEVYYVKKRPYMAYFLEKMSQLFELVIFTASIKQYADKVIDYIDPKGLIKRRFYRDSCTKQNGQFCKELTKVSQDLSRTFIIDNSTSGFSMNPDNGLLIKSWYTDGNDRELVQYGNFLEKFFKSFKDKDSDVRKVIDTLKKKFPKHIIN